jgi:hypothetical protein
MHPTLTPLSSLTERITAVLPARRPPGCSHLVDPNVPSEKIATWLVVAIVTATLSPRPPGDACR